MPSRRLRGAAWRRLRRRVLDRDGWQCVICSSPYPLEVDHRVPVERGGGHEMRNLQTLCRGCHIRKTRRENMARHTGPRRDAWRTYLKELVA